DPSPPEASASRAKRPAISIANDMGAALAGDRGQGALEVRDDRALAARLDVADRRLDLGSHAAGSEMAGALVGLHLRKRHGGEALLARLAEIDRDALDRREDEESLDAERARELDRGEVLVDYRLDALPVAVRVAHHRDAAAAAGDHHRAGGEE